MEYCTGGLLTTVITDTPGASAYFKGGLVAHSGETLVACGVDAKLIDDFGIVSPEVTQVMAEIARLRFEADIGISISGAVGADDPENKPAGTMYIGIDSEANKKMIKRNSSGDKLRARRLVVANALFELRKILLALG
jgi:PncC family amidohydrolase